MLVDLMEVFFQNNTLTLPGREVKFFKLWDICFYSGLAGNAKA